MARSEDTVEDASRQSVQAERAAASERLVSVIVPTRNSAQTLEACLASVRRQSHPSIELVVVDRMSTDQTLAIAARFADIVENYGVERSSQRNRGAELAHGEYLLFIDSDMILTDEVVTSCIVAMQASAA